MMHIKNLFKLNIFNSTTKILKADKSGLSLIEAIFAILIVGISVSSILALQIALTRGVFNSHNLLIRIAYIKNLFIKAELEKLYAKEAPYHENIEDPPTQITYNAFGSYKEQTCLLHLSQAANTMLLMAYQYLLQY